MQSLRPSPSSFGLDCANCHLALSGRISSQTQELLMSAARLERIVAPKGSCASLALHP